jgi:hypothetical protein
LDWSFHHERQVYSERGRQVRAAVKAHDRNEEEAAGRTRCGGYRSQACHYAGIHYATMMRWMALGREQEEGEFREFYEAINEVAAEIQIRVLEQVQSNRAA